MFNRILNSLLFYRHRMGSHTFLIIASAIIGIAAGTAAVIHKTVPLNPVFFPKYIQGKKDGKNHY